MDAGRMAYERRGTLASAAPFRRLCLSPDAVVWHGTLARAGSGRTTDVAKPAREPGRAADALARIASRGALCVGRIGRRSRTCDGWRGMRAIYRAGACPYAAARLRPTQVDRARRGRRSAPNASGAPSNQVESDSALKLFPIELTHLDCHGWARPGHPRLACRSKDVD